MNNLKDGCVLELKIRYNTWRNSPLDADYDDGVMALADGEVGFWFMGDWVYPTLAATSPDVTYGFLQYFYLIIQMTLGKTITYQWMSHNFGW